MTSIERIALGLLLGALAGQPAWAAGSTISKLEDAEVEVLSSEPDLTPAESTYFESSFPPCGDQCCSDMGLGPWFGGIEYRYLRPSFSEAVAFVTVTDTLAVPFGREVEAEELRFDYDSSGRIYFGVGIGSCQDIRFSYWNLDADVAVAGTADVLQTIVDPFGNIGLAGASIDTSASVHMNVFDLEYLQRLKFPCQDVEFVYSAGVRFANVDQGYRSTIRNAADVVTSIGVFTADFDGVGPYFTIEGSTSRERQFSLLAKCGGAVLIGSYDVESGVTIPGVAVGGQSAERIRAVPILEGELGGSWHPSDRFTVSAGYLVQAWFNIGTSGGTFDGETLPIAPIDTAFGQTDDADIMSFDGFFARAELWF